MMSAWLSLLLLGTLAPALIMADEDKCPMSDMDKDDNVYLFGFGYSWGPYERLNSDGELMGLGFDITRAICKIMKKHCEYAVYYDYSVAWDDSDKSISLNDGWYTALTNWVPNARRLSAYSFFGEYANEPASYMFVRRGNNMDTVEEITKNANRFGFRSGFRTNAECLSKALGVSLDGKAQLYADTKALEDALADRALDVIFVDEIEILDMGAVERVGDIIKCASGGMSTMVRKDMAAKFEWYDKGLKMIQENKDYTWLCNMNSNDVDPGCYDV